MKELALKVMWWVIGTVLEVMFQIARVSRKTYLAVTVILATYVASGAMLWNEVSGAAFVFSIAIAMTLLGIVADAYGLME